MIALFDWLTEMRFGGCSRPAIAAASAAWSIEGALEGAAAAEGEVAGGTHTAPPLDEDWAAGAAGGGGGREGAPVAAAGRTGGGGGGTVTRVTPSERMGPPWAGPTLSAAGGDSMAAVAAMALTLALPPPVLLPPAEEAVGAEVNVDAAAFWPAIPPAASRCFRRLVPLESELTLSSSLSAPAAPPAAPLLLPPGDDSQPLASAAPAAPASAVPPSSPKPPTPDRGVGEAVVAGE
jgi:hypothetical protein